jgi:transposase-like protein
MVFEHQADYRSQWKAICAIAESLGVNRESLRVWVRLAETDAGPTDMNIRSPQTAIERRFGPAIGLLPVCGRRAGRCAFSSAASSATCTSSRTVARRTRAERQEAAVSGRHFQATRGHSSPRRSGPKHGR